MIFKSNFIHLFLPKMLCAAVNATKMMTAQQVVKDEQGQEVVLSFGKTPAGTAAAAAQPKYLDDEDVTPADNGQSLARPGDATGLTGWLSKGFGFISKSLYW